MKTSKCWPYHILVEDMSRSTGLPVIQIAFLMYKQLVANEPSVATAFLQETVVYQHLSQLKDFQAVQLILDDLYVIYGEGQFKLDLDRWCQLSQNLCGAL